MPHPNCSFPKKISEYIDAINFSVLLMAIGLNLLSIFIRVISFAPKKKSLRGSGNSPSPLRLISLVSDFRKLSPALPFDLLTRSLKLLRKILSGHPADLFGKGHYCFEKTKFVCEKTFQLFWIRCCKLGPRRVLRQQFLTKAIN